MKKALTIGSGIALSSLLPLLAFAQTINDIDDVGKTIVDIINTVLVPVLFAIAFIVFLWGAFSAFILGAQDEKVKENGRNLMIWGLIGFFIMVAVWGLVHLLLGTFNLNNAAPTYPTAPYTTSGSY